MSDGVKNNIQKFSQTSFCSTVTGITPDECDALKSIYDSTGGAAWTTQTGWGVSTTPCSWYGVTCSGGHVTGLNLSSNTLTGIFEIMQGNLNALTSLSLRLNQLTSFSGTGLTSLAFLDLDNNDLTSFEGTKLTSLTELSLSHNQLTSFSSV